MIRSLLLSLLGILLATGLVALLGPREEATGRSAASPLLLSHECAGKPSPPIGDLTLRVVDRPAPDRVVLEGRWTRGRHRDLEDVDLVLPDGATLLEGPGRSSFKRGVERGVLRWLVSVPEGRDLDAVVRIRADLPDGPCARERPIRLQHRHH